MKTDFVFDVSLSSQSTRTSAVKESIAVKKNKAILFGKVALIIGLPILVLFGMLRMWMGSLGALPVIQIPTHAMPAVNARDYFIKAADQIQSKEAVDASMSRTHSNSTKWDHPYSDVEKAKLVADNALCVATLRRGFAHPYMESPLRSSSALIPHLAKFRELARLLRLEANTRAAQGDYKGAVTSCLDAIQIGQMVPRGGALINMLVGIAITAIGERDCSSYASHLSAPQARAALKRLEAIRALHVPYADVLTEEKYFGQAILLEMFRKPDFAQSLREDTGTLPEDGTEQDARARFQSFAQDVRFHFVNKRASYYNYTNYMDAMIAGARQPYNANTAQIPIPTDPICLLICPVFSKAGDKDREDSARTAMLELHIAIRAYELEHGHLPDTPAQLVPAYLKALPDDPHAAKGSYGYTRDKVGYTLFSTSGYVLPIPKKRN